MRIWWRQTTWVVLVPIITHIPSFINVAHTELWIFDYFVISQSEQLYKWGIKYAHLVTTDHVGSTCAHHYLHTISFISEAHSELWIFDFFVIIQSEQICKWGTKMRIRWRQTTWVVLVPPTTHIPSLTKIGHCVLIREEKVYLLMLTRNLHLYIHLYIHSDSVTKKTKWTLQHSWWATITHDSILGLNAWIQLCNSMAYLVAWYHTP